MVLNTLNESGSHDHMKVFVSREEFCMDQEDNDRMWVHMFILLSCAHCFMNFIKVKNSQKRKL